MAQGFKETAHLKTNLKNLHANWDLIDWGKKEEVKPDPIQEALEKYKKLHFKPISCIDCQTTEAVKHDEASSNDYCWPCLEKYLRANQDELFESVDETPDYNY